MEKIKVVLSIDAGGTSTRYAFIDEKENILYLEKTGPGSPAVNRNAETDIFEKIKEIIYKENNQYEIICIAIGMSGFALVNVEEYKDKLWKEFNVPILLENDAYMALMSVLKDKYKNGTVVISGTGAIVLSINNGNTFYANGWGELLTERSSGYGLVKDYVCNMIRHYEQKGFYTPLEQQFLDYMGYQKVEEFKMLFYRHSKNEVAKYCTFFFEKVKEGNEEAKEWMVQNGVNLGIDVVSSLKRVEMNSKFVIGFRGGVFDNNPIIIDAILKTIKENGYDVTVEKGEDNPIYGGYYLAKREGLL